MVKLNYRLGGNKYMPPEIKDKDKESPGQRARTFLGMIDEAIEFCDTGLFALYMANVFSNSERAFCDGSITKREMISLKESAAGKILGFTKNCECEKKSAKSK